MSAPAHDQLPAENDEARRMIRGESNATPIVAIGATALMILIAVSVALALAAIAYVFAQ